MKKSNEAGLTAIETLLILVILAIISFTSWYVWHARKNADATLNTATNSAQTSTPKINKKTTTPTVKP